MHRNPEPILPASAPLYPVELKAQRERRRCAVVAAVVVGACAMFAALVGGVG